MIGLRFHRGYALAALSVFLIEVAIALWVRDAWIRPHGGDVVAVVLVYLGLRAITSLRVLTADLLALAIAFAIETGQYFHLARHLGLDGNVIARTVIGTGFDVRDLLAYAIGALAVLLVERAAR